MSFAYDYPFSAFIQPIDSGRLQRTVLTDDTLFANGDQLVGISIVGDGAKSCIHFVFGDELSPGSKSALDAIVATTPNAPPFDPSLYLVSELEKLPPDGPGEQRYVTDCRLPGEGPGEGTGCWVWWREAASAWLRLFDNGPVEA